MPSTPEKTVPPASPELFERLMRERAGDNKTKLSNPTWMSNFQIHRRLVASYRISRVFLAGDAAHVHSPFGGQGANTGIQDAYNLAWKLALVIQGKASAALLDTYQEERRPVAQKVLEETHHLTSIFFQRNLFMRMVRDQIVVPLLKQPGIQRRLLWEASELGIHYRSSTLSQAQRGTSLARLPGKRNAPQAGDRAPDGHCLRLPMREETTLFQVFENPVAHLLLFDGSVLTETIYSQLLHVARSVEKLFKDEIKVHLVSSVEMGQKWEGSLLLDTNHSVHAHYGIRVPSLAFIRPDGYIGILCPLTQERELIKYLQQIYLLLCQESLAAKVGSSGATSIN